MGGHAKIGTPLDSGYNESVKCVGIECFTNTQTHAYANLCKQATNKQKKHGLLFRLNFGSNYGFNARSLLIAVERSSGGN